MFQAWRGRSNASRRRRQGDNTRNDYFGEKNGKRNCYKLVTLKAKHKEGMKMTMGGSAFFMEERSPSDDYNVVIWQI
jgi:hypothetical protein